MKLFYSVTSPYVRKVRAVAISLGISDQITLVPVDAHASPPELLAVNPLSKVPCLITADGAAIFDSPVICEYLDMLADGLPLIPRDPPHRVLTLRMQAIGDGLLDAMVLRRMEQMRPEEAARRKVLNRQRDTIIRTLDFLERDAPATYLDVGTISVACALGYADFRFSEDVWRDGRPGLTAWFERISETPGLRQTGPEG
jgi:glutathione S-transferase